VGSGEWREERREKREERREYDRRRRGDAEDDAETTTKGWMLRCAQDDRAKWCGGRSCGASFGVGAWRGCCPGLGDRPYLYGPVEGGKSCHQVG